LCVPIHLALSTRPITPISSLIACTCSRGYINVLFLNLDSNSSPYPPTQSSKPCHPYSPSLLNSETRSTTLYLLNHVLIPAPPMTPPSHEASPTLADLRIWTRPQLLPSNPCFLHVAKCIKRPSSCISNAPHSLSAASMPIQKLLAISVLQIYHHCWRSILDTSH
jgi:hypothetical protein